MNDGAHYLFFRASSSSLSCGRAMTADHAVTDAVIEPPTPAGSDPADRPWQWNSHPSRWLPRCSRCGRWIAPPGGEGFGDGETWCAACVFRHLQRIASEGMR